MAAGTRAILPTLHEEGGRCEHQVIFHLAESYPLKKSSYRPKIVCSPSYVDFRSRANATRGLDFDHMMR
jgi:hypothetical protein